MRSRVVVALVILHALALRLCAIGMHPEGVCVGVKGLVMEQRKLCTLAPAATSAAFQGFQESIQECHHQLRWHRWNCSTLTNKSSNPYLSAILQRGFAESAFAMSLISAGVAHSVSRACSRGEVEGCSCNPSTSTFYDPPSKSSIVKGNSRWKWGGCSNNIDFGIKFSEMFLDSRESADDLRSKINLHNSRAGRLAMTALSTTQCKCHGMSGSCQVRTCWRAAPAMRLVGRHLGKKLRSAAPAMRSNLVARPRPRASPPRPQRTHRSRRPRRKHRPTPRRENAASEESREELTDPDFSASKLLYYERSPSFCDRDPSLETWGTSGRRCTVSQPRSTIQSDPSKSVRGSLQKIREGTCASLCCGRGHSLRRETRATLCRCHFRWCCAVDCDTCYSNRWVAICK